MTEDITLDPCVPFYEKLKLLIVEGVSEEAVRVYANWAVTVPAERMRDAEPIVGHDNSLRLEWDDTRGVSYTMEIKNDLDIWLCRLAAEDKAGDIDYDGFVDHELMNRFFIHGAMPKELPCAPQ